MVGGVECTYRYGAICVYFFKRLNDLEPPVQFGLAFNEQRECPAGLDFQPFHTSLDRLECTHLAALNVPYLDWLRRPAAPVERYGGEPGVVFHESGHFLRRPYVTDNGALACLLHSVAPRTHLLYVLLNGHIRIPLPHHADDTVCPAALRVGGYLPALVHRNHLPRVRVNHTVAAYERPPVHHCPALVMFPFGDGVGYGKQELALIQLTLAVVAPRLVLPHCVEQYAVGIQVTAAVLGC